MNQHFRLSVVRVQCIHEQVHEWGKDELNLIAYGVARRGATYATGYRSLGSYGEGDVRTTAPLPLTLFEGELPSDGLDNVLLLWLVEQDGAGVRDAAASLDAQFLADQAAEAAHLLEIGYAPSTSSSASSRRDRRACQRPSSASSNARRTSAITASPCAPPGPPAGDPRLAQC